MDFTLKNLSTRLSSVKVSFQWIAYCFSPPLSCPPYWKYALCVRLVEIENNNKLWFLECNFAWIVTMEGGSAGGARKQRDFLLSSSAAQSLTPDFENITINSHLMPQAASTVQRKQGWIFIVNKFKIHFLVFQCLAPFSHLFFSVFSFSCH